VQGAGALLDDPTLPPTQPVTVQLLSSSGVCWQAVYSAPPAASKPGQLFKDKAD